MSIAVCSGDGNIELHAPIYLIASKERAMSDVTSWPDGSNTGYKGRRARARGGDLSVTQRNRY